jgi:hypothetical protein
MDGCNWLANMPGYPLKKSMQTLANIVIERSGVGGAPLSNHPDTVVYLPSNTDDYSGAYHTSPGRRNIPAATPPWSSLSEKKFLDALLDDLNKNMLAGRDKDPNLSRSAIRPAMYTAIRTGAVEAAVFVGASNALNLAYSASALGLDAYQLAKGGWKLSKDNVDKIIPDLKEILGSVPPDTPVVFFCLDNSCFMGLSEDGTMTNISRSVEGDDGFHVKGALVVTPDKALKHVIDQLKRLIEACGSHPVFVISPWPRFVRCPCCSELGHTSNFSDPDFLKSIVSDLNKLRFQLRKLVSPASVLDGLELVCGSGYNLEKVRQVVQSGWGDDPVHPYKHTYAKTALNLMERMSASNTESRETTNRKRTWSSSNSDSGSGGCKSGGGGGGRPTHRSSSWKDNKDNRSNSSQDGGYHGYRGGRDGYYGGGSSSRFPTGDRHQRGGGGGPRHEYGGGGQYGWPHNSRGGYR